VAGQVAHDFNNLLAPLVAFPEFIRAELPEDHSSLKYLKEIEAAAEQMAEIRTKRQQRPEFQLASIAQSGGLTPQERGQLTSAANRQLGKEAEGLQQAYQRNLAAGGGRQVGQNVRFAGNRLLGAQLDVQNRLNEIAVDRKQKALLTLLEFQEKRRDQRQARNQAEQAQKMNIIGQIFGIAGRAGLAAVTGGASEAFRFGSQTPGAEAPTSNFEYDQTRYA
jgi:hypothetical protein